MSVHCMDSDMSVDGKETSLAQPASGVDRADSAHATTRTALARCRRVALLGGYQVYGLMCLNKCIFCLASGARCSEVVGGRGGYL
jgi:hypothetical protein